MKICNLEKFVFSLPKKENTIIWKKRVRLSGDQKQRVGISKTLCRDPSLLIFDGSTNAFYIKMSKK